MFSINSAYDLKFEDCDIDEFDEHMDFMSLSKKEGIGISVIKTFCGGKLLEEDESPFH